MQPSQSCLALLKDLQQSRGYQKHTFGGGPLLLLCPGGSHAAPKPQELPLLLPTDTTEPPSRSQRLCKDQAPLAADGGRQVLLQAVLETLLHPSTDTYMDSNAAMVPSAKIQVVLHKASPADTQLFSLPSSEEKGREVALCEASGYRCKVSTYLFSVLLNARWKNKQTNKETPRISSALPVFKI